MFKKLMSKFSIKNMVSRELEQYLLYGFNKTKAGVVINSDTAMRITTVYSCVQIISETFAQLPIQVYRKTKDGKGKIPEQDHYLYKLLGKTGRPNSFQTPYRFKLYLATSALLKGNAYALINRSGVDAEILELLPLITDNVKVIFDKNFNVSYEYKLANGNKHFYSAEDIFHLRCFGTNGITGLSVIQQNMEALGLAKAGELHGARFLANFAQPAGIISTPADISREKAKEVAEAFKEQTSGDNAFNVSVMHGGATFHKITMTNEEAQYLDLRKYQRTEIAAMFRVPPHKVGAMDNATFSNIEHQGMEFVTDTMQPWVTNAEEEMNNSLVSEKERGEVFVEFNLDALLRGDSTARTNYYGKLWQIGAINVNEIRDNEGYNPRVGGDVYYVPVNMMDANKNGLINEVSKG